MESEFDILSLLLQIEGSAYTKDQCSLFGNTFGYMMQLALGVMAFSTLLYKHLRIPSKGRRKWKVWAGDVGKQCLGSFVGHLWNLWFAELLTTSGTNPCLFYLVNFTVDSCIGCVFNWLLLRLVENMAVDFGVKTLAVSGRYGDDPENPNPKIFLLQLGVWLWIITVVKVLLLYVVVLPFREPLYDIGEFLMMPVHDYPKAELVLVMIIIPLVGNTMVYWITDQFLMAPTNNEPTSLLTSNTPYKIPQVESHIPAAAKEASLPEHQSLLS